MILIFKKVGTYFIHERMHLGNSCNRGNTSEITKENNQPAIFNYKDKE